MKHLISTAAAVLFFLGASAQSALPSTTKVEAQQESTDEVRQMSGQLKEVYGMVTREIAVLDREIGSDASKASSDQSARRDKLVLAQKQLEGMLTTVNSGDRSQWAEVKAKAETVRTNALALITSRPIEKK